MIGHRYFQVRHYRRTPEMRSITNPYVSSNRHFDRSVRGEGLLPISCCYLGVARCFLNLTNPLSKREVSSAPFPLPPPTTEVSFFFIQPIMSMFNAREERGKGISLGTARLCQTACLCCRLLHREAAQPGEPPPAERTGRSHSDSVRTASAAV